MAFSTTPPGSRGARQPGRGIRLMNRLTSGVIRRKGKLGSSDALLLTTVGRKTGQERTSPVNWFPGDRPDGTDRLIIASAAGAPDHPAWYYNLAAHPDQVRIELGGRSIPVIAQQLSGSERDAAWSRITAASAQFAGYEKKTDRELPVIRLTPR